MIIIIIIPKVRYFANRYKSDIVENQDLHEKPFTHQKIIVIFSLPGRDFSPVLMGDMI